VNERIKLPAQEWLGYDPEKGDIHGYTFEQMEKFAELIVADCVELCSKHFVGAVGTYPGAHNNAVKHCVDSIRSHFGVE
jgi:hypothetical protein